MRIEDGQKVVPLLRERNSILQDIAMVEGFKEKENDTFYITLSERKDSYLIPKTNSVLIHALGKDETIKLILENLYTKLKVVEEKIDLI